jgi:hypothetical protein
VGGAPPREPPSNSQTLPVLGGRLRRSHARAPLYCAAHRRRRQLSHVPSMENSAGGIFDLPRPE